MKPLSINIKNCLKKRISNFSDEKEIIIQKVNEMSCKYKIKPNPM